MHRNWTKIRHCLCFSLIMSEHKCPQWIEENPQRRTRDDGREIWMKSCAEPKVPLLLAWNRNECWGIFHVIHLSD